MSPRRRKLVLRRPPVVVDIGCGCRRISLLSSFHPKPTAQNPLHPKSTSDTSFCLTSTETATSSSLFHSYTVDQRKRGTKSSVEESEAVVKRSSNPYVDFRDSMAQMIVEMEIYERDELRRLLHRFLSLNSPRHHHVILKAFAEICHAVFSPMTAKDSGDDGSSETGLW